MNHINYEINFQAKIFTLVQQVCNSGTTVRGVCMINRSSTGFEAHSSTGNCAWKCKSAQKLMVWEVISSREELNAAV